MSSSGGRLRFKSRGDHRGVSVLLATIMTIMVLLALGAFLVLMAENVTPSGGPAMGALDGTRRSSDNYTFSIIALTSSTVQRDRVSVIVQPYNSTIYESNITGPGDYLHQGDTFTVGNLHPGDTYVVFVQYKDTGVIIASLTFTPY
jgi:hypothetical protein